MRNHTKRYIIAAFIALVSISAILLVYRSLPALRAIRADWDRITSESYDTVFLSMFPTDNYDEQDFVDYRGQNMLKTSYSIPDISTLKLYMKEIASSGNAISTVYLGVRPEKVSGDALASLPDEYPSVTCHIILPYPSMDYWSKLSDQEMESTLDEYRELTELLLSKSNVMVYSFSREWLICNPANYDDTFLANEDVSKTLMLHCDELHEYFITPDNIDTTFTDLANLLEKNRTSPDVYPDLSDYKIVLFGDSVIGNYTDSTSIPGVVSGLTGATTYNCGYNGNSAAYYANAPINLPGIVDAFISRNTSPLPEDTQVHRGVTEYLQDTSETENLCFVINYGLNDYFIGLPVSTEDPFDVASYSGALRTAVTSLQHTYPEAQIILMTPNFTCQLTNGEAKSSEAGGILTDYVNAVKTVGAEYGVDILDNYTELGINPGNYANHLEDGTHPNAATRFTIGRRIIDCIK